MKQKERDIIYMQTGAVAEFVGWLYEDGKLNVASAREAQQLGEQFFERLERVGVIAAGWRDFAHIDLFDWAGTEGR